MTEKINDFIIFCIEIYKEEKNKAGEEIYNLFKEKKVFDFLKDCYDILHTQGDSYIIESISEFIKNN